MRRVLSFLVPVFTLLASAPLMAQDFGKGWVDRITHQLIEEEGSLSPSPVEWKFTAGELYTYDSNLFLTKSNRTDDSIFTTFANASVKVAEATFDAEADLMVNYNAFVSTDDVNADEERFFGRIRYQGSNVLLGISEIFRRESSPTDATFTTRVSRFLSNTTPMIVVHASPVFAVEVVSDLQLVNYLRQNFNTSDNFSTRSILTLAYTTGWNAMDLLVQAGYLTITYQDPFAAPDATGFVGRLGVRGELSPKLQVVALAGVTSMSSDDYVGTSINTEMTTADIEVHVAYLPGENTSLYADYSRRFGFSAGVSSFQVVDTAGLMGVLALREDVKLRSRLEYNRVHEIGSGVRRAYYSFGLGADWKVHPHVVVDAGVTYRWGVTPGSPNNAGDFGDAILTLGAAVLF